MRSVERIDLATIEIASCDLPAKGERLLHDATTPGLALRLRASGARSWVLLERANGRTARRTLGNATLIPLDAARRMAGVQTTAAPSPADPPSSVPLFGREARISDVLPRFLASGEKGRWKASTLRNMRAVADAHILPGLGQRKVSELAPQDVTCWHLDVSAKSTAARMALSTLSGLMLYAEDHGLRDSGSNPCRGLRKKQRSHRGQLLPVGTVKRLWAALDELQDEFPDACDAVRLLLLTGARRSEILGLEWDCIAGPRAVLEDSKTGPRTIWLNAPARAILNARKEAATGPLVFPAPNGDGPIKVIDRAWSAIRKEADLGSLRVHDLRHHFASVAVSNGIDIRLVGQLLGHRDIDSTLGYAHLATVALAKSASRVSSIIDRSLSQRTSGKTRHRSEVSPHRTAFAGLSSEGEARHA